MPPDRRELRPCSRVTGAPGRPIADAGADERATDCAARPGRLRDLIAAREPARAARRAGDPAGRDPSVDSGALGFRCARTVCAVWSTRRSSHDAHAGRVGRCHTSIRGRRWRDPALRTVSAPALGRHERRAHHIEEEAELHGSRRHEQTPPIRAGVVVCGSFGPARLGGDTCAARSAGLARGDERPPHCASAATEPLRRIAPLQRSRSGPSARWSASDPPCRRSDSSQIGNPNVGQARLGATDRFKPPDAGHHPLEPPCTDIALVQSVEPPFSKRSSSQTATSARPSATPPTRR
jgi:hypothetical protein